MYVCMRGHVVLSLELLAKNSCKVPVSCRYCEPCLGVLVYL